MPKLQLLNFGLLFLFLSSTDFFQPSNAAYNVVKYGAKPNGRTDSTTAFQKAWTAACNSIKPATFYAPKGTFLIGAVVFTGPCRSQMVFQIDGTLVAPLDFRALGNSGFWILFHNVNRLTVYGGTIDARGAGFWACRKSGKNCNAGARSITLMNCKNVVISGLTSINSQIMHVAIQTSKNVLIKNMKIIAPSSSPNTDGIHLQASSSITMTSSTITTGDDCISVGPGNKNLWIENIMCGPGHGISIGSLGDGLKEAGVHNVTVTGCVFTRTQNGVRIKTWARPSNGFVKNVIFQNCVMKMVDNPIIIDQNYCPGNQGCPHQKSGVKISKVTYRNIKGTSRTPVAMKFDCSPSDPCSGIKLQDIKLTYMNKRTAKSYCKNAGGTTRGAVIPKSCL